MIRCYKCGNQHKFREVFVGGLRIQNYTQEADGRIVFDGSDHDKVDDTHFECAVCSCNLNSAYKKFLQALFTIYDEKRHGP